ncbi:MAG: Holliday junction branch migration protein RuvA [Planctomycetota bacterium]
MFEYVVGEVAGRSGTSVVIEAGGVGYELLAPLGAPFPALGARARVWAHLVVREDSQTLYGFPRREDRDLFRILLRVRGVGPGMALGILSGLAPDDLVNAVVQGDLAAFTRVKGVGKKTGEQILLDLRDKTALLASLADTPAAATAASVPVEESGPEATTRRDAIAALVSIGYSEKEAGKAIDKASETAGTDDLESLVLAAMRG